MGLLFPSGSTVIPALLALEALGYEVRIDNSEEAIACKATRDGLTFAGPDPVWVLGLLKLADVRGMDWDATDEQIDEAFRRYPGL